MAKLPTTELDAVNAMLRSIGESPVSALSGDVGVDVVNARDTLDAVLTEVLKVGWQFNTEHEFPLTPDSITGEIVVPTHASTVDIKKNRFGGIDPVQRGNRIYDRCNHTYQISETLYARMVFLLSFDECPQSVRSYVYIRAVRQFCDNSTGATDLHRYNERDEFVAKAEMLEDQSEDADLNFLRDDPLFGRR